MFLDLTKLALEDPQEYSLRDKAKNLGPVGLLAAAPFGANIGRRRMKHYNKGDLVDSLAELKKRIRAGDIILSGGKELSPAKFSISLATGNPKGYHVGVAARSGSENMYDSHPRWGYGLNTTLGNDDNIQILRPRDPGQAKKMLARAQKLNSAAKAYHRSVKNKLMAMGYSAKDAEHEALTATGRLYKKNQGIMAGIKDLFTPKVKGKIEQDLAAKKQLEDTAQFISKHKTYASQSAAAIDKMIQENLKYHNDSKLVKAREFLMDKIPAYKNFVTKHTDLATNLHLNPYTRQANNAKLIDKILPPCAGGVCSTVPAVFGGKEVVPGKGLTDILPADYLKSDAFEPIARLHGAMPASAGGKALHMALEHAPTLARIGVATGLGVGAYAGIKHHLARQAAQDNTKVAKSIELSQLIKAKKMSDQKDYVHKNEVIRRLLEKNPKAFKVDSHLNSDYVGLTHIKSGFKIHAPKSIVPSSLIHPLLEAE
jgi:hypothetical protein